MEAREDKLKIAFIHPDLGIGGAERLVVDAALGLQRLGHEVDVYTSHHDPGHCFEETRDGTLRVHNVRPPFPRAIKGKFHILFAHLRQLHLTYHLLCPTSSSSSTSTLSTRTSPLASQYDVFFVDQLSTCIPLLRSYAKKRVVFYVHFPDKLLADGEFVAGKVRRKRGGVGGVLKRVYRVPMDWVEEVTTGSADVLLANSRFTVEVFNTFFRIPRRPRVVYPGINLAAYALPSNLNGDDPDIKKISSDRPTLLSLNRFEKKKNIKLALQAFVRLRQVEGNKQQDDASGSHPAALRGNTRMRLVLAGGFDPRLQDNIETIKELMEIASVSDLDYCVCTHSTSSISLPFNSPGSSKPRTQTDDTRWNVDPSSADVIFLLNFSTPQRAALLNAPSTIALLYTPANEHFGIVPVEAMACGLPVLACDSGGPTESVLASPPELRTGWLCPPDERAWSDALREIINLSREERDRLAERAKNRAKELFGMEAMARGVEEALYDAVKMGPVELSASASVNVSVSSCRVKDALLAVLLSLIAYAIFKVVAY